ncbi:MAG: DUF58 domain-containing protein [Eubacteriales bacterium]|nr:DUF58 domain-containing protein [Eubacteriales bacterium]
MSAVWALLAAFFLAALQAALFAIFNLHALSYRRYLNKKTVYEGEKVELVEVIRNMKILPVPWLRAESRISPFLRFGRQHSAEREISAEQYHKSVFFLAPFRQVTRRHTISCLHRGCYDIGSVALTTGDIFGMSNRTTQTKHDCTLEVWPRLLSENELTTPCTRWQGEMAVRRYILPDPFLVANIRGYMQGDPLRDIHWRATARTGSLQVKVRDYTADPKVLVLLNVQTKENQWGELMDYEQETIEQGIRIAATLCERALRYGSEAGFASNACYQGEKGTGQTIFVPARRSADQLEQLFSAMSRMIIHYEATFQTFLDNFEVSGADILILSAYESEGIRRRMREMELLGNSVAFMPLENLEAAPGQAKGGASA